MDEHGLSNSHIDNTTDPFAFVELQPPSYDVLKLDKIRPFPDRESLKF